MKEKSIETIESAYVINPMRMDDNRIICSKDEIMVSTGGGISVT